jgi:drug/metabolite transporter (DMT)-like permease
VILSLLSGVCYSFYIIYLKSSGLNLHFYTLTLYLSAFLGARSFGYGALSGQLNLSLTPAAWVCAGAVSVLTSLCAVPLFQLGVRLTGPVRASMLSTLEPITGLLFAFLLLGETATTFKLAGAACIITSVALISKGERPAVKKR